MNDNSKWTPLENTLMVFFMYMGRTSQDGGPYIYLYKHIWTRRYLNLDSEGKAYRLIDGEYHNIDIKEAIAHVFYNGGMDYGV